MEKHGYRNICYFPGLCYSGFLIGRYTDDPRPWIDAIAFSISLTAGIISFLRYNNQYYWWLASGLAQMVLWYISFTHGSASLAMFVNSSVYLCE